MSYSNEISPKYVYYLVYTQPKLVVASFCLSRKKAEQLKFYLESFGSLPLRIIKFEVKDLRSKGYIKHIGKV